MPRIFVLAALLAIAASAAILPELWALSQSYINEGRGLHPFLCGAVSAGLAGVSVWLAAVMLNNPRR